MPVSRVPSKPGTTAEPPMSSTSFLSQTAPSNSSPAVKRLAFGTSHEDMEKLLLQALTCLAGEGLCDVSAVEAVVCLASCIIDRPYFGPFGNASAPTQECVREAAAAAIVELVTIGAADLLTQLQTSRGVIATMERYVGIIEDDPLHGEQETPIGQHVALIVGCDIGARTLVVFDPFDMQVTYWQERDLQAFEISRLWSIK
eukprot:GEMP01110928.1.p1 GENE.GEMP01110928.1~~GEMP01110928.1.p1  ORF type:complete len:201 (+),score=37.08 GEMP01110928.1:67-669(+)